VLSEAGKEWLRDQLGEAPQTDADEIPLPPEPEEQPDAPGVPSDDAVDGADLFDDDPVPLARCVQLPPFPVDRLPAPIAEMVRAVSEATQTDPAMAGTSALSALSACTGGHAEIEIRAGWREPLCLYTITIALPGERKSAVQQAMVRPILDVESRLVEQGIAARMEAETRKQVAVKDAELQRNVAAKADPSKRDAALANAIGATAVAESIEVPAIPRLVADDVTPEAAASLLAEQRGRLAIISAEGGIFDIIAGRYSRSIPNMDLWLKGHSGDPIKVDRKGRPPEYIRRPALTLGLMIQPTVLGAVATNREFRGRGFLARILYSYPVSKVGRRKIAPRPVDPAIEKHYQTTVASLASGMSGWLGDPAILILTETAQKAIQAIEEAVEPTLAGDGELAPLADWGAKYVGAIARIAGILHLAEHGSDTGPTTPVTAETILAASRIGAYFKACAVNAFNEMGTDQGTADAVYLLDRIQRLDQEQVSERDMHVATKSRFKKKADLIPALERLVEYGYLILIPAAPTEERGRPASPRYRVHPCGTERTERTKT
jgi:replicative DNA helicase